MGQPLLERRILLQNSRSSQQPNHDKIHQRKPGKTLGKTTSSGSPNNTLILRLKNQTLGASAPSSSLKTSSAFASIILLTSSDNNLLLTLTLYLSRYCSLNFFIALEVSLMTSS